MAPWAKGALAILTRQVSTSQEQVRGQYLAREGGEGLLTTCAAELSLLGRGSGGSPPKDRPSPSPAAARGATAGVASTSPVVTEVKPRKVFKTLLFFFFLEDVSGKSRPPAVGSNVRSPWLEDVSFTITMCFHLEPYPWVSSRSSRVSGRTPSLTPNSAKESAELATETFNSFANRPPLGDGSVPLPNGFWSTP